MLKNSQITQIGRSANYKNKKVHLKLFLNQKPIKKLKLNM